MVKKLAKVSRSSSCKPLSKGSPIFELPLTYVEPELTFIELRLTYL